MGRWYPPAAFFGITARTRIGTKNGTPAGGLETIRRPLPADRSERSANPLKK